MKSNIQPYEFNEIINSLDKNEKKRVNKLHEQAIYLGYVPKISLLGEKPGDWKCEYKKKKDVLYILRITNDQWSVRCKLFNLAKYNDVLSKCNKHLIETLLKNSGNCGHHGGGCKGPIEFSIDGKTYLRCRHSFMFTDLLDEDVDNIRDLLECENSYYNGQNISN
ncbi:hypothetical protein FACS1894109_09970 [Spirochaetia bacterium]|nr:hypothetical protein FACS1894109_09970 [Spirochaetia bacterium]